MTFLGVVHEVLRDDVRLRKQGWQHHRYLGLDATTIINSKSPIEDRHRRGRWLEMVEEVYLYVRRSE